MMIPIIYDILLLLMLYTLYEAGIRLRKNDVRILSKPGILAIAAYTLNEGLRFGRGIDYCNYWPAYDSLARTGESTYEYGFELFQKILISIGLPFQVMVLLMSLFFITATLVLMKSFKSYLPWGLVFFVLLSLLSVENMVRWYMAFSFIMIGLHFQIEENRLLPNKYFLLFSIIACFFHLAILPVPLLFYLVLLLKRPLLTPGIALLIFVAAAILFETDYMLNLTDSLDTFFALSERFEHYNSKADYWLTSGFRGIERRALPGIPEMLFIFFIVYIGYKIINGTKSKRELLYSYNLFVVGLVIYPISRQIELLGRYQAVFFFFRAIVLAAIIINVLRMKMIKSIPITYIILIILTFNTVSNYFINPFRNSHIKYMYIWNSEKKYTADYIHGKWWDEQDKAQRKRSSTKKKSLFN